MNAALVHARVILVLALWSAHAVGAAPLFGRVVGVHDGDTLTLLTSDKQSHRVRVGDIDAPELGQPFGKASKLSLSELCFQKHAVVQVQGLDRWGRVIGRVDCAEADVAAAQIQSGMAWVYRKYSQRPGLLAQEARAQDASVGLWAQPAVEPWVWRQQRRRENHL